MKSSEVLRKAAKMIEDRSESYSCWAIVLASGKKDLGFVYRSSAGKRYIEMLGQPPMVGLFGGDFSQAQQGHRATALCLAAAIAESEGD